MLTTRKAGTGWAPCLADQDRGVAFFDGITVYTDSITDPRHDRVSPVYEEDQIYLSRLIAKWIGGRKGLNVLDVNTASGAHAIQCARLGCAVQAIDGAQRSYLFARSNLERNGISLSETAASGTVCLAHTTLDKLESTAKFDLIILNTPFNPTFPGKKGKGIDHVPALSVALHAASDDLGQKQFHEQLEMAVRHLAPGGSVIGRHLALKEDGEAGPSTLTDLFARLGVEVDYHRVDNGDYPVVRFLEQQYEHYLVDEHRSLCNKAIRNWICDTSKTQQFCFVVFVASIGNTARMSAPAEATALPPWDWNKRINFHRQVVEHTSFDSGYPTPALFLERDALPPLDVVDPDSSENDSPFSTILEYIGEWIWKSKLLDKDGPFDMIWIDSAPWYPTEQGIAGLRDEGKAWVCEDAPTGDGEDVGPLEEMFVADAKENIAELQRAHIDTFLHPAFTGEMESNEWRPVLSSINCAESQLAHQETRPCVVSTQQLGPRRSYAQSLSFSQAGITDHTLIANERAVFARIADTSNLEETFAAKAERLSLKSARDQEVLEKKGRYLKNRDHLLLEDLANCHKEMHDRLDNIYMKHSQKEAGETWFLASPIALASPIGDRASYSATDYYRGCVWIYAWFKNAWSIEAERELLDLTRIATLMIASASNNMAAKELGQRQATGVSQHEVKHVINDLKKWIAGSKALASISQTDTDFGAVLFPDIFKSGLDYLKLWALSDTPSDLPFYEQGKEPTDLNQLIKLCWKSALDALLFSTISGYVLTPGTAKSARLLIAEIQQQLDPESVQLDGKLELIWSNRDSTTNDSSTTVALSRLLIHIMRECIQHGSWDKRPSFSVEDIDADTFELVVRSKLSTQKENELRVSALAAKSGLSSVSNVWTKVSGDLHGTDVYRDLVKRLGAKSELPGEYDGFYEYRFEFTYGRAQD